MPSRRKINDVDARPDRHWRRGQYKASVHLLRPRQSRPAAQSQGSAVLSDHAGPPRVHAQSPWLRLPRFGSGRLSQKRSQSELAMGTIYPNRRRSNANLAGAQCGDDTAAVPEHRSARTLFLHNGYAKSLKQLVHFYNRRDVFPFKVTSGHCPEGKTEKVDAGRCPRSPTTST